MTISCPTNNLFPLFDSDPHNISFHFLIPEGGNDKLPYHKLKVVLPDANITVTRWAQKISVPLVFLSLCLSSYLYLCSQKQIKDKLNVATPEGNFLWSFHKEFSPLLIGTTQFSKKRYVYTAADSIIKVLPTLDLFTQTCHWPFWKTGKEIS
jgi:hypothetical protein